MSETTYIEKPHFFVVAHGQQGVKGDKGDTGATGAGSPGPQGPAGADAVYSNATPIEETVSATAVVGVLNEASRADHRHAMPGLASVSVDGFMAAADKVTLAAALPAASYTAADVFAKVLTLDGTGSGLDADLLDGHDTAYFAPINDAALTGVPTAPTAAVDTSTTQIATTAFVTNQAASATPLMDGAAAVGTSKRYARGDHVHPTDTSRLAAALFTVAVSSISLLTPAADKLPYYDGASTAALTTLTAFGRSLIDDADAAAGRTTLGLGALATKGDADYGDITVTASGATWTIDNQAVTYAKIQNVSATDKLLGRETAGAGVVEEIACTAFGRSFIAAINAGAGRSVLALGTLATQGDGDKGDITVSGTGAAWTVDNQAISYAKIQNISAADRLLGRSTAGAGVVEEITCTAAGRALIDDASAAAQRTTLGVGTNDTVQFGMLSLGPAIDPAQWSMGGGDGAVQVGTYSGVFGDANVEKATWLTVNASRSNASGWKYLGTEAAVGYKQRNGVHTWQHTAAGGVVGNALTWVTGMTLTGTDLAAVGTIQGTRLISTVSIGTAPLTVTSTTKVTNLYADRAALADTVTTNANLTGPITSSGNATAIAAQTGTGTTFAMSVSPTFTGTVTAAAVTATGTVTLATSGQRIVLYTTDATRANRTLFTESSTNGGFNAGFIPNGTSNVCAFTCFAGSNPDATHGIQLITGATSVALNSGNFGGTQRDLFFQIGSATKALLDINGAFGYGPTALGIGGTVTQATSKATGVTLSKACGEITLNAAALAANTTVSFTLTNTLISAGDLIHLQHQSGGTAGAYGTNGQAAAGSASINVRNITAGSLSEAIVLRFAVIKGVTA